MKNKKALIFTLLAALLTLSSIFITGCCKKETSTPTTNKTQTEEQASSEVIEPETETAEYENNEDLTDEEKEILAEIQAIDESMEEFQRAMEEATMEFSQSLKDIAEDDELSEEDKALLAEMYQKMDAFPQRMNKSTCEQNRTHIEFLVDQYNMSAKPSDRMNVLDIEKLRKEGLLLGTRECPDGGIYSGNNLQNNNTIICSVHDTNTLSKKRGSMSAKDCGRNITFLQGAVEMYNMDHREFMETLDIETLLKEKYIKQIPECPEGGTYVGEDLMGSGEVSCTVHGKPSPYH